jgi:type IV pilus assembly protein PilB
MDQLYGQIQQAGQVEEAIQGITVITGDEDSAEEVDLSPEKASEEDAPIVKLVNLILQEAIKERATDIHIEPQYRKVNVRIRIDGVLQVIMTPPSTSLSGLVTRIKILSKLNIAEKRLPQDGRFSIKTATKDIDVRVSILPTVYGEKIVLRLLDKSGFDFNLTTLGFPQKNLAGFRKVIKQPYGMVVVSGPTGSGKSTSLYAALKDIKDERTNITTVEDPVEYQLDGISQVQVFDDIGLTFGSTLRSILRQDPDVLLIGEIRDSETADIAVKFSLTGHLVFSTVHANDAPGTITRLLDIGVAPFLVGSCLNLVMAQRLVRRICEKCKEEYKPTKEELALIGLKLQSVKGKIYHGKGCADCRNTGYRGRIAIFEMITMSRVLRKLVFDNANEDEIRQAALKQGMESLRDAGNNRVLDGTTTVDEVLRSTVDEL